MPRFTKGQSGNPNGRPKGSKNKITLLRESVELMLREEAEPHMRELLKTAIALAKAGDRAMLKLILELHMSKQVPQDQQQAKEAVKIEISGPSTVKREQSVPLDEVALLLAANDKESDPNGR